MTFVMLSNPRTRSLVWRAALGGLRIIVKGRSAEFRGDIFAAAKASGLVAP